MAVNSQFLFFYIDELIKHHWVDWLEGPLASIPADEHKGLRGFQGAVGDTGAGPRTRAGEAYQLGILSGRIVKPQVAGAAFPSGWQSVIEGRVPATRLGFYSYVIGKALRENPSDPNLERALDCLASIFILHIGFKVDERWFNTALIFQFAYNQMVSISQRDLSDDELRYLSAAVINTLDSDDRQLLLEPYVADQPIDKLRFDLTNGKIVHFKLSELTKIVADKRIGINDFKKTKAALFWANPTRGIFSRASRSQGEKVIQELMKVDQELARLGEENLLIETLDAIQANVDNIGIFHVADENFTNFPSLLNEWQDLEAELFDATNRAAESVELDTAPPLWSLSQKEIRGTVQAKVAQLPAADKNQPAAAVNASDTDLEQASQTSENNTTSPKLVLPNDEAIQDIIDREFDQILEQPPAADTKPKKASEPGKARAKKTDFAEKDARNRKLGESGELFILRYEIQKLIRAGQSELAKRVSWVSKELGDGLGYDIRSFEIDGSEIFLEVKTTTSGRAAPFFVSANEVSVSEVKGASYRLVRVYGFPNQPRFFTLNGSLSVSLQLEATSYRARV